MGHDLVQLEIVVRRFARENGLNEDHPCRALYLALEIGELVKEVLKGTEYGSRTIVPTPELKEELGDVLSKIACITNAADIDLECALHKTLEKMEQRIAINWHPGLGK